MGEVTRAVADLPDAVIGLAPAVGDDVGEPGEEAPVLRRQPPARLAEEVRGLEDRAVGVELHLLDGAVADADRGRPAVAGEVVELALRERALARDAVHDLEIAWPARAGPLEPGLELVGLVLEAEREERDEGQRRVPDPGVAVVPVARSADRLRERGRRRGDESTARRVGERLQRERRATDGGAALAFVPAATHPCPPEGDRRREPARHRRGVRGTRRIADLGGGRPGGLDPHLFAGAESPAAADRLPVAVERRRGAHPDRIGPADDLRRASGREQEAGREEAVLEARRDDDRDLDRARRAAEPAEDRVAGDDLRRLGGVERGDGHAVGQLEDASAARHLRQEHVGVVEIGAVRAARVLGRDLERAAALRVQDAAEDRRGVEAGKAGPVDRAVAPDERRGVAVADERVVADPVHGPRS